MCNLYSMTTTHQAMRQLFQVQSGINQLHLPGIFPDHQAPIIRRRKDGEREARLGALGHADAAGLPQDAHRPRPDQYPQCAIAALARLADAAVPLPRAGDLLLRADGSRGSRDRPEGLDLVRPR